MYFTSSKVGKLKFTIKNGTNLAARHEISKRWIIDGPKDLEITLKEVKSFISSAFLKPALIAQISDKIMNKIFSYFSGCSSGFISGTVGKVT